MPLQTSTMIYNINIVSEPATKAAEKLSELSEEERTLVIACRDPEMRKKVEALMRIVERDHAKRAEILECLRAARLKEGLPV